ncbi:MAG: methyltransferase domain-containing protein [Elusimicrobia bacterium]|nr:methyltransferase domain-containing protein [Elusimicrobiota bacterium]
MTEQGDPRRGPETLTDIVPEYRSRNPVVRWLFWKRIEWALDLAALDAGVPLDVMDLGCGEGALLGKLSKARSPHRLKGMDSHPAVTSLRIPGVEITRGDLTKPGSLPSAAFDRVFCLDVLEHIEFLAEPLGSIRGALRPGGLLVITAPTESLFHKTCRFVLKGTFSEAEGPAAGRHYHHASTLAEAVSSAGFLCLEARSLPLAGPLALIRVMSFRRDG